MPPPLPRGVRARVLAVAVLVLVAVLTLWTWLFLRVLDDTLEATARSHADNQSAELAGLLHDQPPASVVRLREGDRYGDVVVQVLDARGEVAAASEPAALDRPLADLGAAPGRTVTRQVSSLDGIDEDPFMLVGRGATGPRGEHYTVVVASPIHVEEGQASRLGLTVGVAAALLLGVSIFLVRWAVGASLAPVERMRGQVAAIDGHTIGDQVDVPLSGDELERLGRTMNDMLTRLETAYAAQRSLVSDVSHELRSPIATVRANLELAAADPSGAAWAESREVVLEEVQRLQALVDDLLTLSRADAGALHLRRRDCDLDDLVVDEARRVGEASGTPVAVSVVPVRVQGDADRLRQVLRNLLENASRYADARVRVGLAVRDGAAVVTVDDDGPVVPEEQRAAVFERFVRLDPTRDRDTGGSGLGLAIARDLTRAHGGALDCGESPDGWCRFELRLPVSEA